MLIMCANPTLRLADDTTRETFEKKNKNVNDRCSIGDESYGLFNNKKNNRVHYQF